MCCLYSVQFYSENQRRRIFQKKNNEKGLCFDEGIMYVCVCDSDDIVFFKTLMIDGVD